jgi:hypothetical protein
LVLFFELQGVFLDTDKLFFLRFTEFFGLLDCIFKILLKIINDLVFLIDHLLIIWIFSIDFLEVFIYLSQLSLKLLCLLSSLLNAILVSTPNILQLLFNLIELFNNSLIMHFFFVIFHQKIFILLFSIF